MPEETLTEEKNEDVESSREQDGEVEGMQKSVNEDAESRPEQESEVAAGESKEEEPEQESEGIAGESKEEEQEPEQEAEGEEPAGESGEEEGPQQEAEEKEEGRSQGRGKTGLPKPVEVGEEIEVTIESVGAKGDGIAKKEGFVIFVPKAEKGETLKVRITEIKTSFAIGERV